MLTTWQQNVVALTGTIGSGKSTVAQTFDNLGAFVINADDLAREVVEPGTQALSDISEQFGSMYLNSDGSLNRQALGKAVFLNPKQLKALNSIVHPKVAELARIKFTSPAAEKAPLRIYEVPLFFENKMQEQPFQAVVLVVAPSSTCLERIMRRDGFDQVQAQARLDSQLSNKQKIKLADFTLDNQTTLKELAQQAKKVFVELRG